LGILGILLCVTDAAAQTSTTLWTNLTFDWVREKITYEIDFEPKILLSAPEGEPGWRNLDITPSIEYAARRRFDLTGELVVGHTKQTDDLGTIEFTLRGGVRFHLVENQPKRRLVIRDWVRVESRNFFYSNDDPSDSTVRFRNRLELLVPINTRNLSEDGTVAVLIDWEWFIRCPIRRNDSRPGSGSEPGGVTGAVRHGGTSRSTSGIDRETPSTRNLRRTRTSSTSR
jgi:hypothetical protein